MMVDNVTGMIRVVPRNIIEKPCSVINVDLSGYTILCMKEGHDAKIRPYPMIDDS
jgi:hypothetical protein